MKTKAKAKEPKTYETCLVQGQILKKITYECKDKKEGVLITDLPNGTKIKTGGGTEGIITGKQTKTTIQIKVNSGEHFGEYDWVSKDAFVKI